MSLTNHQDKFRMLDIILTEHESFKQEIQSVHRFMAEHKQETYPHYRRNCDDDFMSDDDDTWSVRTMVLHGPDQAKKTKNSLSKRRKDVRAMSYSHDRYNCDDDYMSDDDDRNLFYLCNGQSRKTSTYSLPVNGS